MLASRNMSMTAMMVNRSRMIAPIPGLVLRIPIIMTVAPLVLAAQLIVTDMAGAIASLGEVFLARIQRASKRVLISRAAEQALT
jgi:hypothetical protein